YYEMLELGYNYRLTDFQCALGMSQLKKIESFIARRRLIVERYNRVFEKIPQLRILREEPAVQSAHHLYVLRFRSGQFKVSRRTIFEAFRESGVLVNVHYIPIYLQPYYQALGYRKGLCPVAEGCYEELITLPLYSQMKAREVDDVVNRVLQILKGFRK
ncbi:MAG: UDP-4-amino-4,6-dideoxy-N-acetyl-beta-L-altrosamine transaminase, partial [Candidatus Moranbacteria bacterium]|nr:UDP-4-amino-4,6-dideoxy-N-acetyl-beta-L-altrosamine transaminase [Candidatus Moranbacteria bacterium]